VDNWLRAELELAVVHDYDTVDRDLESFGMTVSRIPVEVGVIWRLRLPRGEKVEAWEPGNHGLAPPAEISELISAAVAGKQLVPAPPLGDDRGAIRLREMIDAQRTAMLTHDPGVRLGSDPENLHEHRVAARRARAFVRATRAYLDPAWRRSIVEPLGLLATATGPVRDFDVLLEHLQVELSRLEEPDRAGGDALLARLGFERTVARQKLVDVLDSDAYRALVARLRLPPRLAQGVESVPLERIARKEFRRLVRAVDRLGKHPADSALHQLRITLKRARYAAELSAGATRGNRRFLTAAKTLQDMLGEYQDAVIAEQSLRETTVRDSDTAAAFVAGRIAERQRARRQHVTEHLPAAWKTLRKRGRRL
jgi:CHAD domain-containing protein